MANDVFANGREIACKAGAGKTICAFPDVCFTPPENPATPPGVPVPYPNTGFASDTSKGSKNVKISDKEIMLKNKSCFKKSTGDEAGCAAKKGVVTSTNTGEVYFKAWSMDVKVEGENVDRHLDLTTNNHACDPGDTPPWVFLDSATALAGFKNCGEEEKKIQETCADTKADPCPLALGMKIRATGRKIKGILKGKGYKDPKGQTRLGKATTSVAEKHKKAECARAMRCLLRPYGEKDDGIKGCCPGQTPHHIPPWSTVKHMEGNRPSHNKMLCVCLEGASHSVGSHGKHHHGINYLLEASSKLTGSLIKKTTSVKGIVFFDAPLKEHIKVSAAVTEAQNNCNKECIEEQIKSQFDEKGLDEEVSHNATNTGGTSHGLIDSTDGATVETALARPPTFS